MKRPVLLTLPFLLTLMAAGALEACSDNGDAKPADVVDGGSTKKKDAAKGDDGDARGDDDDDDDDASGDDGGNDEVDAGTDAGEERDAEGDAPAGSVWHTPVADGTVTVGEYGGAGDALTTKDGQTWSIAWDGTNLYVAETNAQISEAVVLYVGFGGNGTTEGTAYDETRPSSLSFKADAVVYAKSTYNETRTVTAGAWSAPMASTVTFQGSGATREIVIPWSALGRGSIPSSFRFAAYNVSSTNYVYGQIPQTNPGGQIGLSATFRNNYFVASTANGTGSFPFATVE